MNLYLCYVYQIQRGKIYICFSLFSKTFQKTLAKSKKIHIIDMCADSSAPISSLSGCSAVGRDAEAPPVADAARRSAAAATQKISSKPRLAKNFLMLQRGLMPLWFNFIPISEAALLRYHNFRGVAQLVACLVRDQEAGRSSRLTPTTTDKFELFYT